VKGSWRAGSSFTKQSNNCGDKMANVEIPDEVRAALENLIQVAQKHKVKIAGFAMRYEISPFILNFGNVSDMGKLALYELLCEMADDKKAKGLAQHLRIGMVQ
jgi:hypothetical protein